MLIIFKPYYNLGFYYFQIRDNFLNEDIFQDLLLMIDLFFPTNLDEEFFLPSWSWKIIWFKKKIKSFSNVYILTFSFDLIQF